MSAFRSSLVGLAATTLDRTGLIGPLTRAAGHAARRQAFQILSYHRVNDAGDPFFPSLPPHVFERHMRFLARWYRVLTVEALVQRAREDRLPPNAVAITFDDGYRDNLTTAAPILLRYGLPATFFLATGCIGTGEVPWFDRLAAAFKETTASTLVSPWGQCLDLRDERARLRALHLALERLKRQPCAEFTRRLEELLDGLGTPDQRAFKGLMLTWDDVRALIGQGLSIGAHTVSHPILSRVSPEQAWKEIAGSRAMIDAACGITPNAFAYPNGKREDYTPAIARLVRQAGFTCAVTTGFGLNTRHTSPWELQRGGPWEHDLPTFALRLATLRLRGA